MQRRAFSEDFKLSIVKEYEEVQIPVIARVTQLLASKGFNINNRNRHPRQGQPLRGLASSESHEAQTDDRLLPKWYLSHYPHRNVKRKVIKLCIVIIRKGKAGLTNKLQIFTAHLNSKRGLQHQFFHGIIMQYSCLMVDAIYLIKMDIGQSIAYRPLYNFIAQPQIPL